MNELIAPCIGYVVLMVFTPGPNNVSASALGLRMGYRGSLPYLLGIATGFLLLLLSGGLLTEFLARNYSLISRWLKWIGVLYMAWLAISLFIDSPKKQGRPVSFRDGYVAGFLLQFVNPKGILFGITLFTSFSAILTGSLGRILVSSVLVAAISFTSVSTWNLVGSALSGILARPSFHLAFNVVMALLLVYSSVSIALH